jgi:hypothetical protein
VGLCLFNAACFLPAKIKCRLGCVLSTNKSSQRFEASSLSLNLRGADFFEGVLRFVGVVVKQLNVSSERKEICASVAAVIALVHYVICAVIKKKHCEILGDNQKISHALGEDSWELGFGVLVEFCVLVAWAVS